MNIGPLRIHHSASLWRDLHGDDAAPEAPKMAPSLQRNGDLEGADLRLRLIVALEETEPERVRSGRPDRRLRLLL